MPKNNIELEQVETILVFHTLVMLQTSENIDLNGEVLTLWVHKKFYRTLVMRSYLESNINIICWPFLILSWVSKVIFFLLCAHIVHGKQKFP